MHYWVLIHGKKFSREPEDVRVTGLGGTKWNLSVSFPRLESAIDAAMGYMQDHPYVHLDVTEANEYGNVRWCSQTQHDYAVEGSVMADAGVKLPQPINVDREQVVSVLQTNLENEATEREKVEAKERQARLGVDQFVTDHQDEIVEYLGRNFGGSWRQVEERLAEVFKDDAYKPQKMKKSRKETDLEKMVRVLGMSVDKTIEVQPTSPIYDLL